VAAADVADAGDIEATARLIAALARRLGQVFESGMFLP
jgi:hypothetical protein